MKVFLYIFSTFVPTVTIKYSKYLNLRPVLDSRLFSRWLDDIQNYCNSIFICFSNCSYVGICCKTPHWAKSFCTNFWGLKLLKSCRLLLAGALHKFCNLLLQNGIFYLFMNLRYGWWLFYSPHDLEIRRSILLWRFWWCSRLFNCLISVIFLTLLLRICKLRQKLTNSWNNWLCCFICE